MRSTLGGQVNVEVDAAPQEDLSARMAEIRRYYEGVTEKSHKDLEVWFQNKVGWPDSVMLRTGVFISYL